MLATYYSTQLKPPHVNQDPPSSSKRSQTSIIYINICRFIVLIITLASGILIFKNFESYGAIVGGSAWSITLFFEAIFAWIFARKIKKPNIKQTQVLLD